MDPNRHNESNSSLLVSIRVVFLRVGRGYFEAYSVVAGPERYRFIRGFARERAGLLCGGKTGL